MFGTRIEKMLHQSTSINKTTRSIDPLTGKPNDDHLLGILDGFLQDDANLETILSRRNDLNYKRPLANTITNTLDSPTVSSDSALSSLHQNPLDAKSNLNFINSQTIQRTRRRRVAASNRLRSASSSLNPASTLYSSDYGYGLVNAAAAVSQTTGRPMAAKVPNSGGRNAGLDLINAPEAWSQGYTGKGVVVAVVDTGVDYNHVDLSNNIWINKKEIFGNNIDDDGNGYVDDVIGWDFVNGDNNPRDEEGHGTHVSGIIAAENNGIGMTGVAYNAKIMPVRVLDAQGAGSVLDIAKGVTYAADNGADVINLSLGGQPSAEIARAILYATQKGAVVVMAAGNSAAAQPNAPADLAGISGIAVGAVNNSDNLAFFSNRSGRQPLNYVVAPGVNVLSTTPNDTYSYGSGTSMATPYAAGVAALILSANPNLPPANVEAILMQSANPNGIIV